MDYVDYDDTTLKKLQKLELMILKDFIQFCDENNIEYFIFGGSLLGTIRHHGFIPWDDDVDVIMFRKDYEKFVELYKRNPIDKYTLLTAENTSDYFLFFAKLILNGTEFNEWWNNQVSFNQGIFLDIFVWDNAPNNKILRNIHILRARVLNRCVSISTLKFDIYPLSTRLVTNTLHHLFKFFNLSSKNFKKRLSKLLKKYDDDSTSHVFNVSSTSYPMVFLKSDFSPSKKAKFEDVEVTIPNDFDMILTRYYGDYMKLPPESDRYNHVTYNLDFGIYENLDE